MIPTALALRGVREEAKEIYKDRAATAECVNAQARNRGLVRLPVRGLAKVTCVATWFALAHNLSRVALAPHLIGLQGQARPRGSQHRGEEGNGLKNRQIRRV